jgi:hypothetical protein
MKHLDKPAHMGALILMGQIDIHIDRGNGVLGAFPPIANGDRVPQIFDTHLIDRNVAVITLVLGVFHVILEDWHS